MAKFLLVRNCSFEKLLPTDLDCSFVVMVPCAMYLWVELQASDTSGASPVKTVLVMKLQHTAVRQFQKDDWKPAKYVCSITSWTFLLRLHQLVVAESAPFMTFIQSRNQSPATCIAWLNVDGFLKNLSATTAWNLYIVAEFYRFKTPLQLRKLSWKMLTWNKAASLYRRATKCERIKATKD